MWPLSSEEYYVSIDIEADGPIPGSFSMLSLGAAAFDSDGHLLDTWTANLEQLPDADEQVTPRGLRHSYGVAAVEAGVPLTTIAAVLGHADVSTTAIYATAIGAEARELVSRVWTER